MGDYESVELFLEAHRRGRPQSFDEIAHNVNKSRRNSQKELMKLILYGNVRVIVLRFNNRDCPFYTVRSDVKIDIIKGATRY